MWSTSVAVPTQPFQRSSQITFTRPGTYKFICTVHPSEMRMTVTVKK